MGSDGRLAPADTLIKPYQSSRHSRTNRELGGDEARRVPSPALVRRVPVASPGVELAEAVRRRRMVRGFSGAAPAPEVLESLLDLARRAPSAGNSQGWDAVVLKGAEQTNPFWEATTTAQWRAHSARWPGLRRAPVVVAFFSHPGAYTARYREPDKASSGLGAGHDAWPVPYWDTDAAMAVMILLLGAVDAGLGACFLGNFRGEEQLRTAIGVPADRRYLGAVLLGEGGGADPPSISSSRPRRSSSEVFHRGGW